ncbi:hypothetical protein FRC12_019700 [Ceratobasidium sp. 428]|nr:hypothetical protein FRC12_019700 [Ceratobasidium sp. 428]
MDIDGVREGSGGRLLANIDYKTASRESRGVFIREVVVVVEFAFGQGVGEAKAEAFLRVRTNLTGSDNASQREQRAWVMGSRITSAYLALDYVSQNSGLRLSFTTIPLLPPLVRSPTKSPYATQLEHLDRDQRTRRYDLSLAPRHIQAQAFYNSSCTLHAYSINNPTTYVYATPYVFLQYPYLCLQVIGKIPSPVFVNGRKYLRAPIVVIPGACISAKSRAGPCSQVFVKETHIAELMIPPISMTPIPSQPSNVGVSHMEAPALTVE